MGNETSTAVAGSPDKAQSDQLFKLDGIAKVVGTSFLGCGSDSASKAPSGTAISTSRMQLRPTFQNPKAPSTWHPPSAAPSTNMTARNKPSNRKEDILSCNESNVLPQRRMSNRFTAVGGHSDNRISMDFEMQTSEFQLHGVHGPYEKIDVPAHLREAAESDRDFEAQFELGALFVRAHAQQNSEHDARLKLEQEILGTTTPSASPRGDDDFTYKQRQSPALLEALKLFNSSSRRGNVQAQYTLGLCYATGTGVGCEDARGAFPWLLLAAQQNVYMAQWRVGIVLIHGIDIEKDEAKGMRWLQRAAAGRCGQAMADLALIYLEDGHTKEVEKMVQKAEDAGVSPYSDRSLQYYMSVLYSELARQVIDVDAFK